MQRQTESLPADQRPKTRSGVTYGRDPRALGAIPKRAQSTPKPVIRKRPTHDSDSEDDDQSLDDPLIDISQRDILELTRATGLQHEELQIAVRKARELCPVDEKAGTKPTMRRIVWTALQHIKEGIPLLDWLNPFATGAIWERDTSYEHQRFAMDDAREDSPPSRNKERVQLEYTMQEVHPAELRTQKQRDTPGPAIKDKLQRSAIDPSYYFDAQQSRIEGAGITSPTTRKNLANMPSDEQTRFPHPVTTAHTAHDGQQQPDTENARADEAPPPYVGFLLQMMQNLTEKSAQSSDKHDKQIAQRDKQIAQLADMMSELHREVRGLKDERRREQPQESLYTTRDERAHSRAAHLDSQAPLPPETAQSQPEMRENDSRASTVRNPPAQETEPHSRLRDLTDAESVKSEDLYSSESRSSGSSRHDRHNRGRHSPRHRPRAEHRRHRERREGEWEYQAPLAPPAPMPVPPVPSVQAPSIEDRFAAATSQIQKLTYSGERDKKHPMRFLKAFLDNAKPHTAEDHALRNCFAMCMTNQAADWISMRDFESFPQMQDAFVARFWSRKAQENFIDVLMRGKYSPNNGESISEYAIRMCVCARYLTPPMPDSTIVNNLIRHYPDKISKELTPTRTGTMDDLLETLQATQSYYEASGITIQELCAEPHRTPVVWNYDPRPQFKRPPFQQGQKPPYVQPSAQQQQAAIPQSPAVLQQRDPSPARSVSSQPDRTRGRDNQKRPTQPPQSSGREQSLNRPALACLTVDEATEFVRDTYGGENELPLTEMYIDTSDTRTRPVDTAIDASANVTMIDGATFDNMMELNGRTDFDNPSLDYPRWIWDEEPIQFHMIGRPTPGPHRRSNVICRFRIDATTSVYYMHPVVVVEDLPYPMVLGRDFLKQHRIAVQTIGGKRCVTVRTLAKPQEYIVQNKFLYKTDRIDETREYLRVNTSAAVTTQTTGQPLSSPPPTEAKRVKIQLNKDDRGRPSVDIALIFPSVPLQPLAALIDTGSTSSCINEQVLSAFIERVQQQTGVQDLKRTYFRAIPLPKATITAPLGDETYITREKVALSFNIIIGPNNAWKFQHSFYVVPTITPHIILGADFLNAYDGKISLQNDRQLLTLNKTWNDIMPMAQIPEEEEEELDRTPQCLRQSINPLPSGQSPPKSPEVAVLGVQDHMPSGQIHPVTPDDRITVRGNCITISGTPQQLTEFFTATSGVVLTQFENLLNTRSKRETPSSHADTEVSPEKATPTSAPPTGRYVPANDPIVETIAALTHHDQSLQSAAARAGRHFARCMGDMWNQFPPHLMENFQIALVCAFKDIHRVVCEREQSLRDQQPDLYDSEDTDSSCSVESTESMELPHPEFPETKPYCAEARDYTAHAPNNPRTMDKIDTTPRKRVTFSPPPILKRTPEIRRATNRAQACVNCKCACRTKNTRIIGPQIAALTFNDGKTAISNRTRGNKRESNRAHDNDANTVIRSRVYTRSTNKADFANFRSCAKRSVRAQGNTEHSQMAGDLSWRICDEKSSQKAGERRPDANKVPSDRRPSHHLPTGLHGSQNRKAIQ